jgi:hypothetical protein
MYTMKAIMLIGAAGNPPEPEIISAVNNGQTKRG